MSGVCTRERGCAAGCKVDDGRYTHHSGSAVAVWWWWWWWLHAAVLRRCVRKLPSVHAGSTIPHHTAPTFTVSPSPGRLCDTEER